MARDRLICLLLILVAATSCVRSYDPRASTFTAINVTTPVQFATVLVSEDYRPAVPPSQFFGLSFIAVTQSGVMYALSITVWHQIQFATAITLNHYDNSNGETLVLFVATGNEQATSNNCPINVILYVDKHVLNFLNNGQMYMDITSDGQADGQLRGNFYRRNDLLIAFVNVYANGTLPDADNYYATQGMAIVQIYTVPQQGHSPDSWLGFSYYIISAGLYDGANFQALQVGTNNIVAYLGNNTVGSVPATGIYDTGLALERKYAIVDSILYGPGSTEMFLTMLLDNTTLVFTPFVRLYRPHAFTSAELEFVGSSDGEEGPLHPNKVKNRQERTRWGTAIALVFAMVVFAVGGGLMIAYAMGKFPPPETKTTTTASSSRRQRLYDMSTV